MSKCSFLGAAVLFCQPSPSCKNHSTRERARMLFLRFCGPFSPTPPAPLQCQTTNMATTPENEQSCLFLGAVVLCRQPLPSCKNHNTRERASVLVLGRCRSFPLTPPPPLFNAKPRTTRERASCSFLGTGSLLPTTTSATTSNAINGCVVWWEIGGRLRCAAILFQSTDYFF